MIFLLVFFTLLYIFCVDLDLVLFIIMFSLNVIVTTFARGCFRCTCMLLVSHILELGLLTVVLYLINYHVFSYTGKLHWTYDYSYLFFHCYNPTDDNFVFYHDTNYIYF